MFNNSIGIQYNWREGQSYPLTDKLGKAASNRIKLEPEHVTIDFPDDQAPGGQNRKLLDRILPAALPQSEYSNVYLRLPAPAAGTPLLRAAGRINVPSTTDATDFLANFTTADAYLITALRADTRYPYYNELFQAISRVAGETGMMHTLEFEFEDKDELETEMDMVFVSCMLED